jgi:hypothetical protein
MAIANLSRISTLDEFNEPAVGDAFETYERAVSESNTPERRTGGSGGSVAHNVGAQCITVNAQNRVGTNETEGAKGSP